MKIVKGLQLVNDDKLHRAIHGSVNRYGLEVGGLIEKYIEEDKIPDDELLAAYDKLGGAVFKGDIKVESGSFYDFLKKQPKPKSEIVLLFKDLRGRTVKLKEDEAVPVEVQAALKLAKEDKGLANLASKKKDSKEKNEKAVKDKKKISHEVMEDTYEEVDAPSNVEEE